MKIRTDFVTNSSSSSFVCVAKVNKSKELMDYLKEEYGKYGISLLNSYTKTGKEIKEDESYSDYDYEEFKDYCHDCDIEISDDDTYLAARFYVWSSEGDSDGDDAWLYDHIPKKFKEVVYEGQAD